MVMIVVMILTMRIATVCCEKLVVFLCMQVAGDGQNDHDDHNDMSLLIVVVMMLKLWKFWTM